MLRRVVEALGPRPWFRLAASQVECLKSPKEYRDFIMEEIGQAKRRIRLAALYLGAEQDDVCRALSRAMADNANLRVSFLFDYMRCVRNTRHGTTLEKIAALKRAHPRQVEAAFYAHPFVPKRWGQSGSKWSEILGVMHMKFNLFDDTTVLTG